MMIGDFKVFVLFFLLLFPSVLIAQPENEYIYDAFSEKIYLQLDSEVYTTNKTIWFKAIITNTALHNPNLSSGVLYVDLIDSKKEIVESKIVKLENGIGSSFFDLNRSYHEGDYLIRAYTEWNKNFGGDFMFEKYIQVFSETKKETNEKPIQNLRRIDTSASLLQSKADIHPQVLDLQFFPESGELVHGLSSKIGFKAIHIDGKGTYVKGVIVNSHNDVVSEFESNALGMGSFILRNLDSSLTYHAQLKLKSGKKITVALPKVSVIGTVMTVSNNDDKLNVFINSNHLKDQKISLNASCRGHEYYSQDTSLINGSSKFIIPKNVLPEGVIVLTLFNEHKTPIAVRLSFNQREDNRVIINANLDKNEYSQREKLVLDMESLNSKRKPIHANLSVLAVKKREFDDLQKLRENILSYFLLSSDLKGTIENPGAYFNTDSQLNIDDLLLTQGWRRYKYKKINGNFNHIMEQKLQVSGIVNSKNTNNKTEEVELMLMTFDDKRSLYTNKVMVPGSFNFELSDMYGVNKDILVQTINGSEEDKKKYTIALNKKRTPPIYFDYENRVVFSDSLIHNIVLDHRNQKIMEDDFNFSNDGRTILDEVVLDGYNMTPERKKVYDEYGKPDVVIDGKEINEKTAEWSYGLYSVLRNAFGDRITISRGANRDLRAQVGVDVTLVVVDGIPVVSDNFQFTQYISPQEVTSFEIIKNPPNFKKLYVRVFPLAQPPYPNGSVIAIYTKKGKGLYGALGASKDQLDLNSISVFSIEKEFYSPTYEVDNSDDFQNLDLRTPLYWNPKIETDKQGKATVEFYNADITDDFLVIIEAISNSGQLGYKCLDYSVKDKDN